MQKIATEGLKRKAGTAKTFMSEELISINRACGIEQYFTSEPLAGLILHHR